MNKQCNHSEAYYIVGGFHECSMLYMGACTRRMLIRGLAPDNAACEAYYIWGLAPDDAAYYIWGLAPDDAAYYIYMGAYTRRCSMLYMGACTRRCSIWGLAPDHAAFKTAIVSVPSVAADAAAPATASTVAAPAAAPAVAPAAVPAAAPAAAPAAHHVPFSHILENRLKFVGGTVKVHCNIFKFRAILDLG